MSIHHTQNPYSINTNKYSTHSIIQSLLKKNTNILDIGCNDGYIGKSYGSESTFYGLEYSQKSVEIARKYYKQVEQYDLNYLIAVDYPKADTLIFADVLEHVIDPEKALNFFVSNNLKSEGNVIISLPNIANWQVRLRLLFGKFDYTKTGIMDETHLHFYTYKSAKKLAQSAGLEVVQEFGGASFFGPLINLLPFLKGLLATNIIVFCKKNHD
jgi:2-polyprenyl-3-methyl-5-hydroxy-6-metoxy-1,4-benzoquinol methylase